MKTDNPKVTDKEMLDLLLRETFGYFNNEVNENTGLIADTTKPNAPSSIAAVGMGLSCYVSAVEQELMSREEAVKRTHKVLQFFITSKQGTEADAAGYKGFYYHFLNMETGKREWKCEISTIDTAILIFGILTAKYYYNNNNKLEKEIGIMADELYERVDWQWALNGKDTISHGWKPETGFIKYRWNKGYSEAHLIYILALGSPTFPINPKGYKNWIATFNWEKQYDIEYIYAGPLFIHQMAQIWIDFKGIMDDENKKHGIDYFENSRRATRVQQLYAIENPLGFAHYGSSCWGFTASDGPGNYRRIIKGKKIKFYSYKARGIPYGPDDGTISPWAVVASLPFEPGIVISTVRYAIEELDLKKHVRYGFDASFNPTFPEKELNPNGWISKWQFGINQGPVMLMIENYNSGLIWNLIKKCPYITTGLKKAGFTGGWLDEV